MPDIVLHNEMATRVLRRLDEKIITRIDESVFQYGVMAPDAYMSYRFIFPRYFRHGINKRGAIMHEKKCGEFLIRLAHNCHDDKDFSILCGFICHFALDSTLHPLINQLTDGHAGMHEAVEHALDMMEEGFKEFFEKEVPGNPQKAEYLIPIFIGELLEQGKMSVKVLKTNDTWYGMTYHEDVAAVKDSFKKMLENGVYKADLFSDL